MPLRACAAALAFACLPCAVASRAAAQTLYHFDDIANLSWLDAKYTDPRQKSKPFLALQAGRETSTGSALLGQIDSFAFGAQLGANVSKTINVALGYDQIFFQLGADPGSADY